MTKLSSEDAGLEVIRIVKTVMSTESSVVKLSQVKVKKIFEKFFF